MVEYLSYDELVLINREILKEVKAKKADTFEVLSRMKLIVVLESVEKKR